MNNFFKEQIPRVLRDRAVLGPECVDDPIGWLAQTGESCANALRFDCDKYDHDYNGYVGYIWQMCPVSCDRCEGYNQSHYISTQKAPGAFLLGFLSDSKLSSLYAV